VSRTRRELRGRVAAVTGGARGIGAATARALSAAGMRVAVGDLDPGAADGAAELALALDVTDRASFAGFLAETERRLGPLDALVNNAGIMPIGAFVDETARAERAIVEINVHGVLLGMHLALPGMLARRRGHIVNIASTGGRVGVPGAATYCGSKFFVYGASEALRGELRGSGIDLSCVMPGMVRTELTSGLREPRFPRAVDPEEVAAAIVATLRRPRFDVFVPRSLAASFAIGGLVPRVLREAMGRALGADDFCFDYDAADRAAYAQRVIKHTDLTVFERGDAPR
jgi:NADP-dependent 3-hydroxy acid dehydrogenase YdfG